MDSDGRPAPGAQVLARVPMAPWHPYHFWVSIALQSAVLAFYVCFLQKHRIQAFRSFSLDCICFRLELLLSCLRLDANMATSAIFEMSRQMRSPAKKSKRGGAKGSVAL